MADKVPEIVERVALAILNEIQNKPPEAICVFGRQQGKTYGMAVMYARAAIAAMREPTKAMVARGEMAIFEHRAEPADWSLQLTREGWETMVDAALQ